MSRAQEYRKRAEAFEASAKTAHDLGARQICLQIAEQYGFLANLEEFSEGRARRLYRSFARANSTISAK